MCQLLVGLGDVTVRSIEDIADGPLVVHIELTINGRPFCHGCGAQASVKDRAAVMLTDLPAFGRATRLVWHKRRWQCKQPECEVGSWTEQDLAIAHPGHGSTDRAGRWSTWQVGREGRAVSSVADELDCDWHTIMDAVAAYGQALVDHPDRFAEVIAIGLDETQFARIGKWRKKQWSTSIVDVKESMLLDVVEGSDWGPAAQWLENRPDEWLAGIRWATLDMSGSYRKTFNEALSDATQVADPFHVVKLANKKVDDVRRRVTQETLGHRGRKDDDLWRARKKLVMAVERLDEDDQAKLKGLLAVGDPRGEVSTAHTAKEAVREFYSFRDPELADGWLKELSADMRDVSCPAEIRQLGRTLRTWHDQVVAWHTAAVSNGPTESMNNLCKRIKRVAFGMTNFKNWRIRCLLYAGKPDWDLLPGITPVALS